VTEDTHRILSEVISPSEPPGASVAEGGDVDRIDSSVTSTLTRTARSIPDLVRRLAQSALPESAITTICQSLNAEPLPPRHSLVVMPFQTGRV
jgi:hypothetical protein